MNIFPRPDRPRPTAPPRKYSRPPSATAPVREWRQPWPQWIATLAALFGLIVTAFAVTTGGIKQLPSEIAQKGAIGVALTLLASFALEARIGIKNLVRADLLGIVALFYLTLYEFLFDQPYFDVMMPDPHLTQQAVLAVIIGFSGLFLGRHLVWRGKQPFEAVMRRQLAPGTMLLLFWGSFVLGFIHMPMAEKVNWDIPKMFDYMLQPRFNQPWMRGSIGDWRALLYELNNLLFLLPPLAGLMFARRERYSRGTLLGVALGLLWTLFYSFVGGTRSQFGAFLVCFLIAFIFASPIERRREIIAVVVTCAALMIFATRAMLDLRTIGARDWWEGNVTAVQNRQTASVFVDDNLVVISKIIAYFPKHADYLGLEVPWLTLVRPIPRKLWPGKPTGLSVKIETAVGAEDQGFTVAATFIGEAYMGGAFVMVALQALVFGMLAGWWNRFASPRNSELGILIYASGFFAVVITMRSTFALTQALLVPAFGIIVGKLLLMGVRTVMRARAAAKSHRPAPRRQP